jgi:hypothetical protein
MARIGVGVRQPWPGKRIVASMKMELAEAEGAERFEEKWGWVKE